METLFSGVYSGKTVLVTGHTGFKGTWLVLWLQLLGARVIGYALAPHTEPSLFHLSNAQEGITHILGDTRDISKVREVCQTYRPDFVFHLAAQSLVRYSYEHPVETYETNVMGTIHLLEAIRATPSVRVCVNVTSDKCYENREWEYSYRENDSMGGYDPYSSSKGCAELITAAYRRSFFKVADSSSVRLASVRAGNVIGGGDWSRDRLIPDCMRSLAAKNAIIVRNPEAIRPWQYVLEPLSGYLWLGACLWNKPGTFEGSWNFGPHPAGNVTVREIVNQVVAMWGEGEWKHACQDQSPAPHEARTLTLDITKSSTFLGWEPVTSVAQAITETIGWYLEQHRNPALDVKAATLTRINHFVQAATAKNAVWTAKGHESL
ncbi:CDP-glucose 4,6-dehydratase [Nitrospira sp. Nam74]